MRELLLWLIPVALIGCAATQASPGDAAPSPGVSWPFEIADATGREFIRGTVNVHDAVVDVAVHSARLLPNTSTERIESVRAVLVHGDTARSWDVRTRSKAVRATQLRALGADGSDTVRFVIPRRNVALGEHYLAFELEGQVRPPGFDWGEGFRHLFAPPDFFQRQGLR